MVLVVERAVVLERLLTAGLVADQTKVRAVKQAGAQKTPLMAGLMEARIKAQAVEQVAAQKTPLMPGLVADRTKAQVMEQVAVQKNPLMSGPMELLKIDSNLLNLKHLNLEKQQDNMVGLIGRCIPKQMSMQEAS